MNLHHPYQFDGRGRTRDADEATWIRGLVEQVLLTSPGERVMRPEFGSGLRQLVFAPGGPEVAATVQFLVLGSLQRWLGHLITVEDVAATAVESTLTVTVAYTIRRRGESRRESFAAGGGS